MLRGALTLLVLAFSWQISAVTVKLTKIKSHTPLTTRQKLANIPVSGNIEPYGIYWSTMGVGTPIHQYNVALDTGSPDAIISQKGCHGCAFGRNSTIYDPTKSSSHRNISCNTPGIKCHSCVDKQYCMFSLTYETCDLKKPNAPCTISGPMFTEQFSWGGLHATTPLIMGGILNQTSDFDQFQEIHGIVGLAPHYNFGGHYNPIGLLHKDGKLPGSTFAICFGSKLSQGGKMTLGGVDMSLAAGPFSYTPMDHFPVVGVNGLSVGGHPVIGMNTFPKTGLDTGTNIFLVPTEIFAAIRETFQNWYCHLPHLCPTATQPKTLFDKGSCFKYSKAVLEQFPKVQMLVAPNTTLTMYPKDYILPKYTPPKAEQEEGMYCLGILDSGHKGFFITGDSFMVNYYVHYDTPNRRVGWAPVNRTACFN
eukprot:TRINITY_DN52045_c0_g1_i1.p1 TRINITY_DN52045_c0_g1~~TRINITY_DN52045_c0_g1_i1.p1  ORF type:complete len:421 (+),score=23.23 TRINITY_DN52045_c0_g1_i1:13-1275(+)